MTEPENHTLALLREMRAEADRRHEEMQQRFDRMEKPLDAMHQNGIKALKGFIGHRAMAERTMGSFEVDVTDLKHRVEALEAARA